MKKLLALTLALCLCAGVLSGCGGNDGSTAENAGGTENSAENTDNAASEGENAETEAEPLPTAADLSAQLLEQYPVNDGAYDVKSGASENMIGRSLLYRGNTARLAEKLDRAVHNDDKATTKICFLGDSITAGSGATSSQNAYVNLVKNWWEENIGDLLEITNAGIGATDSYLGVHRATRDAIPSEADIYVIEFINDGDNDLYAASMDSLVRMLLSQPNNPAVMILEPSTEGGGSPQASHFKVAQGYDIPMISFHDAVIPEIDAGNFTWKDISPDNVHPNNDGHVIMSQLITSFWQDVIDNLDSEEKVSAAFDPATPAPAGNPFENAELGNKFNSDKVKIVDEGTFTKDGDFQSYFSGGYASEEGGKIVFEITCKNLGMLYEKNTSGTFGTVAVKVDDESTVLIDGNFPGGWGNFAKADEIYSSDEVATHTVKVEFIDDSTPNFNILSWLIS